MRWDVPTRHPAARSAPRPKHAQPRRRLVGAWKPIDGDPRQLDPSESSQPLTGAATHACGDGWQSRGWLAGHTGREGRDRAGRLVGRLGRGPKLAMHDITE
jgi:hypothetical protein